MAGVLFDIREFYGKVWGGRYFPELLRRNGSVENYFFAKKSQTSEKDYSLGKTVQSDLRLRLGTEDMKFIIPPIMTIETQLNSIKTGVAGLDGTIKEIASVDDYVINIKGFLTSTDREPNATDDGYFYELNPSEFPEKELRQLRNFYERKKSLEVVESKILSFFNIKKILLETLSFKDFEGYEFMMPFECSAISDKDFLLKLTESNL